MKAEVFEHAMSGLNLNEVEKSRRQLQIKLDDLINTQGTANKNTYKVKAKLQVKQELAEQQSQLEDELQPTEEHKMQP